MKNLKKLVFGILAMLVMVTNVNAEEATDTDTLKGLLDGKTATTIELTKDGDYKGNFEINSSVTIVGNAAIIDGTITIKGGTDINISNLTMTKTNGKEDGHLNRPEYISVQAGNVNLKVSNVDIYSQDMKDSSKFVKYGTGISVWYHGDNGSKVEVTDSTIHTKYAIWIDGFNNNLIVKNSELSGYAALYIGSEVRTSGNNVTIDNSTLTGYAPEGSVSSNHFGTIAIDNQDKVTIDIINNSFITNKFEKDGESLYDLILMSDVYGAPTNVKVNVKDSTLQHTNDNRGYVYDPKFSTGNTFKATNTTIIGNLLYSPEENPQFYVDFVVDEKSNVVLVSENGKVDPSDIPNVDKEGYTFDGWFEEETSFDPTKEITKNTKVIAKFTKVEEKTEIVVDKAKGDKEVTLSKETNEVLKDSLANTTDKELQELLENNDVTVELQATKVEKESLAKEEVAKFESVVKGATVAEFFDLSILVEAEGEEVHYLKELSKPITLTIDLPKLPEVAEGYSRKYYIIREHDGVYEKLNATLVNGKLSFATDKFSKYALAYVDEKIENPSTLDGIVSIVTLAIASMGVAGYSIKKYIRK